MPSQTALSFFFFCRRPLCVLICKVFVSILTNYPDYLPPNFEANFLLGRGGYFWHGYHWAFLRPYSLQSRHADCGTDPDERRVSPPLSQVASVILGRIQVLWRHVPARPLGNSGWRGTRPMGPAAGVGFALLAVATADDCGTRLAECRKAAVFDEHRRWMQRCYVLLCSAVVRPLEWRTGRKSSESNPNGSTSKSPGQAGSCRSPFWSYRVQSSGIGRGL